MLGDSLTVPGDIVVGNHHAFGCASGARRIDEISQMLGSKGEVGVIRLPVNDLLSVVIDHDSQHTVLVESTRQVFVGQDDANSGVCN